MRVTAAIIEEEGKVLIARRKQGGRMGGKWEFPGGKIEPGETPEQSLVRELEEELGIEARVGELAALVFFHSEEVDLELMVYRAQRAGGEPRRNARSTAPALNDHQEIRWVKPEALFTYDLADSDRRAVEELFQK